MILEVWFVVAAKRSYDKDAEYDWEDYGLTPHKIFHSHANAVDYIVNRMTCEKEFLRERRVLQERSCPGDGWRSYRWMENVDGVETEYWFQIEGYPRYVE